MHIKINPKLIEKDKLYGTTTVGTKGQIVIPVKAREDLKIIPGDDLLVICKHGKALGLIKSEDLAGEAAEKLTPEFAASLHAKIKHIAHA